MDTRRQHSLPAIGDQITNPLTVNIPRARRGDIWTVIKPGFPFCADLLNRRPRPRLHDRRFDGDVVAMDVDGDGAVQGLAATHADAGIAVAPQIMVHVIRLPAVQIALLPPRQRHPQAGTVKARRLPADHDWDRGIAALDQRLGALLVWPHGALPRMAARCW